MFLKMCFIPLILVLATPTFGSSDVDLTAAPVNKQPTKPPPPPKEKPAKSFPIYAILTGQIRIPGEKDEDENKKKDDEPKNKPAKH